MATATQEVPNKNLYVNALQEMLQIMENDPGERKIRFEMKSDLSESRQILSRMQSTVPGTGYARRENTVISQEPFELCGGANAFNPQELVFSAFNSRLMVGYVLGAAARGITLDKLEIQMSGELDLLNFLGMAETPPAAPETLHFTVRVKGSGTPGEFQDIHKAVMKTATTRFNLTGFLMFSGTLIIE